MTSYDVVTVGGGVAGAVVAKAMADLGCRVLVVERETRFKDRVRGEFLFPWGVAEARELGVYDALIRAGAHHPTYWADYAGPEPLPPRNLADITPQKLQGLCMYHPRMQEALLQAAAAAGAEVRRGARVRDVVPGREPTVLVDDGSGPKSVAARLVVGADGRSSVARRSGQFEVLHAHAGNALTGVLLDDVPASAECSICMMSPALSRMVLYFPQTQTSGRAYLASRVEGGVRFDGDGDFARFLEECTRSGLAAGLLDGARRAGPLATFDGADSWVSDAYQDRCALVGDAAATSDPTWGQGLSLALHDARVLRDALHADGNWAAAGRAYAAEHARYHGLVRTATSWFSLIFLQPGPDADAVRQRVLPQLASDSSILPDTFFAGPDLAPPTDSHRERIFGRPGS